jgi:YGGT family protein
MTDVERTTTRETQATQPAVDAYGNPAPAPAVTNVRTTESAYVARGPGGASVAARIVTLVFGVLQALLILRIILLLLVANAGNDVVRLIFNITQPFVDPFLGMFALNRVTADQGSTFDIAALVALVGWTLVELLILAAIRIFARRPSEV